RIRSCARRSAARWSGLPKPPNRRPSRIPGRSASTSTPMPERNLVQAVRDALDEEMARDERVCVLGEDVGRKGGECKATEGPRPQGRAAVDTAGRKGTAEGRHPRSGPGDLPGTEEALSRRAAGGRRGRGGALAAGGRGRDSGRR